MCNGKNSRGIIHIAAVIFIALAAFFILGLLREARKQGPYTSALDTIPANDHAKGLVYDGLEVNQDDCKGTFKIKDSAPAGGLRARCTHGPDSAPEGFDVNKPVPPINQSASANNESPVLGVTCDGDGVSGKRVQILYVRSSDVPDRYTEYLTSFQQWAVATDDIVVKSAAETGGVRHIRYVHDGNCIPTVENVVISPTGDDNFANTISEVGNLGYNRDDRKYAIFMDAHVYCGIAVVQWDDRLSPDNINDLGPRYSRIDNGCWNQVPLGHEIMHTFGTVQLSSPNSSGEWHCTDVDDLMCRPQNGATLQYLCPSVFNERFDCNHDDYFSTNPSPGNYLYDHWNAANSGYLIGADPIAIITKVVVDTLKKVRGQNVSSSSYKVGEIISIVINTAQSGITVQHEVKDSANKVVCSLSGTSGSNSTVNTTCKIPRNGLKGTWNVKVTSMNRSGNPVNPSSDSVTEKVLTVN